MDVYINRGIAKSDLGDKKGAIADYTEAIRVNPKIAFNYDFQGLAKHDLGDYQGAIADYNETVRLRSNVAASYLHRGLSNNTSDSFKTLYHRSCIELVFWSLFKLPLAFEPTAN